MKIDTINCEKRIKDYIALVDEYIIPSSTDLQGKISDVSKAFCSISQYSDTELLGQNHSIIRHEDMNKEVYSNVWKTISNNQCWKVAEKYVLILKIMCSFHAKIEGFKC